MLSESPLKWMGDQSGRLSSAGKFRRHRQQEHDPAPSLYLWRESFKERDFLEEIDMVDGDFALRLSRQ